MKKLILLFAIMWFAMGNLKCQIVKAYGTHGFSIGGEITINSLENSGYKYELSKSKVPDNKYEVLEHLSLKVFPKEGEVIYISIDYFGKIEQIRYSFELTHPEAMNNLIKDFTVQYGEPTMLMENTKTHKIARWDCKKPTKKIEVILTGFASTYNNKINGWGIINTFTRCLE